MVLLLYHNFAFKEFILYFYLYALLIEFQQCYYLYHSLSRMDSYKKIFCFRFCTLVGCVLA